MVGASARLLKLLSLLQSRAAWPGVELAARLEVDVRTLRRDVDKLRTLGYVIASAAGVAGGYRLGAGESVPPLLLSDDEAVSVAVSLLSRTIAGESGQELAVLAKLEQLLPPRLRKRVRALAKATEPLSWREAPVISSTILLDLAVASRQHQAAMIRYRDRAGVITRRIVEPHGLVSAGSVWYMPAWDQSRGDWRTFRLDRVEEVKATGAAFVPRKIPKGAADFVSESLTMGVGGQEARLRVWATIEEVQRKIPATAGKLEAYDENSCTLRAGVAWMNELAAWVAAKELEFEVLEPAELRARLTELAERCRRAARQSTARPR